MVSTTPGALVSDLTSLWTLNIFKVPFLARSISKSGITSEPDSLILLYNFFNMKREAQCVALIKPNFSNPMCNLNTFKQISYKRYCNHDHLFCKSTIRCHRLQLNTSPQGVWHSISCPLGNAENFIITVSESNILTSVQTKPFVLVSVFYQMVLPQINIITTALFS